MKSAAFQSKKKQIVEIVIALGFFVILNFDSNYFYQVHSYIIEHQRQRQRQQSNIENFSCNFWQSLVEKSWQKLRPLSYRNQSIDLFRKSMDWFLYDNGLFTLVVTGITFAFASFI